MNIDSDPSDPLFFATRRCVDRVCLAFETAWRVDTMYRIEAFVHSIADHLDDFPDNDQRKQITQHVLAELICLEMDLRYADRQEFQRPEYYRRFPEFTSVIDESFERILQLDSERRMKERDPGSSLATANWGSAPPAHPLKRQSNRPHRVPPNKLSKQLGPFREITRVGAGGFGIVYRAWDSRHRRFVALKQPQPRVGENPQLMNAFLDEAEKAMELNHPGIVRTHSIEQFDEILLIVQDFIDGPDLEKTLKASRTHPDIVALLAEIADALAYANRRGIIHRDLKPANILMDPQGKPYLADFGMSLHENAQQDMPDQRCGTPAYMSPQLVAGLTRNLDGRTDIWSLGVIAYELLAGRRPFAGNTEDEIFRQIETRDPKPLREIDSSIDKELERICLKCLSKRARDRYLTADDLADDLRHWLTRPRLPIATDPSATFIPKGLRAYGIEDAAFFQQLLPGPRDREQVPASIRFWATRIREPLTPDCRVPIGVIYGPSGSGKSSFVKAGLIPYLLNDIDTCYIEASPRETESQLKTALRDQFRFIPLEASLPEILAGLSSARWHDSPKKILIVIDQFEQRLSAADDYSQSTLAKALRHCCGERLQCLLLVRDEFWLALTRFADALEMDLLEGQNSQDIDLFDRDHAMEILSKLGRAYHKLPDQSVALTKQQHEFLAASIDQLAIDNYVICVRLILFAEMFKSRPWTLAELNSVGGVHGVGEAFLESTFGSRGSSRRFHRHKDSVQAVLEELLPKAGTNIRGVTKSEEELLAASKLTTRHSEFDDLIQALDQDFRLITRCDIHATQSNPKSEKPPVRSYQLTHDYLVPSIRDWLAKELRQTRRGRALLRLRELAAQIEPGKPPKNRPTHLEWLTWSFRFRWRELDERQKRVMRNARQHFLSSFTLVALLLILIGAIATTLALIDRRKQTAANLLEDLIGQRVEQMPAIVTKLEGYPDLVQPELERRLAVLRNKPDHHRRVQLGLLPFKPSLASDIVHNITRPDCEPAELEASLEVVANYSTLPPEQLLQVLRDDHSDPHSRFRAAVSLALLDRQDVNWKDQAGMLGSVLIDEPVQSQREWIRLLAPVAQAIKPTFRQMLANADERNDTRPLTTALYSFTQPEQRASYFLPLLTGANDSQFDSILSAFEEGNQADSILDHLLRSKAPPDDAFATASRTIALLRLGKPKEFLELTKSLESPGTRSLIILLANPVRLDFVQLQSLYESPAIEDDLTRQAILMAFAERANSLYDDRQVQWLDQAVESSCLTERHAGCFSAAELVAKRRSLDLMKYRKRRRQSETSGVLGDVYINSQLQAFSIIRPDELNQLDSPIAVATTETSVMEIAAFLGQPQEKSELDHPYLIRDFSKVYEYCNWLSGKDGLADQKVYPNTPITNYRDTPVDISREGYRLMTHREWLAMSNAETNGVRFLGTSNELADSFAWTVGTAGGQVQDVGMLLPNEHGLFDLYGNAFEACMRPATDQTKFIAVGQTARQSRHLLSPNGGFSFVPAELRTNNLWLSVRLVRRIPTTSESR